MPDLDQIQRWMLAVIRHQGGAYQGVASPEAQDILAVSPEEVENVVTRSRALTALERLDIYNRAYFSRLIECLREEFPVLVQALGEETFDAFALDFLQKYPSRSYTLNYLGTNFPRYLAETRPAEDRPRNSAASWPDFLIDLATLELTYNEVFDGPGVEGQPLLHLDQLLAIPPERWPETRLVPVCCLRLLRLRFPVHRYIRAVRQKKDPSFPRARTTHLAVSRRDYVIRRYELSRLQYLLLQALVAGRSVGEAIHGTADTAALGLEDLAGRLHAWFHHWTAEGFFQNIVLPT
jgi:hypothetical protein